MQITLWIFLHRNVLSNKFLCYQHVMRMSENGSCRQNKLKEWIVTKKTSFWFKILMWWISKFWLVNFQNLIFFYKFDFFFHKFKKCLILITEISSHQTFYQNSSRKSPLKQYYRTLITFFYPKNTSNMVKKKRNLKCKILRK